MRGTGDDELRHDDGPFFDFVGIAVKVLFAFFGFVANDQFCHDGL